MKLKVQKMMKKYNKLAINWHFNQLYTFFLWKYFFYFFYF